MAMTINQVDLTQKMIQLYATRKTSVSFLGPRSLADHKGRRTEQSVYVITGKLWPGFCEENAESRDFCYGYNVIVIRCVK